MTVQKKDNRFNNIIKDLNSKDNKKILTAIKQLRTHGKPEAINHLIGLYKSSTDDEIKSQLTSFLFDLKDQTAVEPIIDAIENEKDNSIKTFLLSIFWQSALDASEHINFLINQSIIGDYMTCVEVLTIVDTFENTFQEDEINDIMYDLDDAIENELSNKKELLNTLKSAVGSLNVEF